jgi:hypothetical protein
MKIDYKKTENLSSNKNLGYAKKIFNILGRTKSPWKLYFSYISKTVKDTKG